MKSDKMSSYPSVETAETFSESFLEVTVQRIEHLVNDSRKSGTNTTVAICGGSCTGKSTIVAREIMNRLSVPFTFLDQDSFQNNMSYLNNLDKKYRWDHPDNFSVEECVNALRLLKNNKNVRVPDYSFKTDEPIGERQLAPNYLVLFEGLYASFQDLQQEVDLTIYAEAPFYARLIRRIFRNTLERYKNRDPALILNGFISSVTDAHNDFVRSQRNHADIVVQMPFSFSDVIARFSLTPIEGDANLDWHIDLQTDLKIGIQRSSLLTLIYHGKKYLDFEIEEQSVARLKELDWFAC